MPVHNAAPYLDASVASILGQSMGDLELVLLDDASDDGSGERLEAWARRDARIRLLRSARRLGIVGAANRVAEAAAAGVCARMDADDVAHPDRLARQWAVLRARPEVALVASAFEGIDAGGALVRPRDRWRLLERSPFPPFPHGSIMYRRAVFDAVGGYREACRYWEDLDFVLRVAARGKVVVLAAALYRYRFHLGSTQLLTPSGEFFRAIGLSRRCLALHRAGRDYDALLAGGRDATAAGRPLALLLRGGLRLWGGHPPDVPRATWREGLPARLAARALLLSTWGERSPGSLRRALALLLRARDACAGAALAGREGVEWRCA
jgi:glycosyltransferase involved in cell wall biosynthesis